MPLAAKSRPVATSGASTTTNTPPAKLSSSGLRRQLNMSTRPVPFKTPPWARGLKIEGSSTVRAKGACSASQSGMSPVWLATMPISQRSGTVVSAKGRALRAASVSGHPCAGTLPVGANSGPKVSAGALRPQAVMWCCDGSHTKSDSLDLPAATTGNPSMRAHSTSPMSKLG